MADGPADQSLSTPAAGAPDGSLDAGKSRQDILYPNDVPKADEAVKPDPEKPKDGDAAKPDDQAPAYVLTMPDGVPLDQALLGEATPVLRDIGLTNDQANKLVPLVGKVQERIVRGFEDDFNALKTDWAKQTKADPDIGGRNWPETVRLAAIAMNAGGGKPGSEFRKLLDESGLGNHPAFIRVFRSLGYQLASKGGSGARKQSRAEILYPDDIRK